MVARDKVEKELKKAHERHGVGAVESQQLIAAMTLQVLLDVLDLLTEIRDQTKPVSVSVAESK